MEGGSEPKMELEQFGVLYTFELTADVFQMTDQVYLIYKKFIIFIHFFSS